MRIGENRLKKKEANAKKAVDSSPGKMWLSTQNRIFSSTSIDSTSMVQVLPNQRSLDF